MKTALIIVAVLVVAGLAVYFGTDMMDNGPMESPTPTSSPTGSPTPTPKIGDCRRTGCSGQICADKDVVTTCEFRPEYACYQTAQCERQPGGQCGWTPTTEFQQCLSRF